MGAAVGTGELGAVTTSCPRASRASSVLGSSVPGTGGSRKGAGSTSCNGNGLERGTRPRKGGPALGGRAGVIPSVRTRLVEGGMHPGSRGCGVLRGKPYKRGSWWLGRHGWVSVHACAPGRDSGCTSWERGGASAAPKARGSFARIHSAFAFHIASGASSGRLRRGHSRRWKRDALLSQRRSVIARCRAGEAGSSGSWPW